MAIVILSSSECPLCNKVLHIKTDLYLFPPMIANINDPLYIFSDAGVHSSCLEKHRLGRQAMIYSTKLQKMLAPENRICDITGEMIMDMQNYISFGIFTSDAREPLHEFNFMKMDKQHLSQWPDRHKFIEIATRYLKEGKWNDHQGTKLLQDIMDKVK
jgi:hypothetical protein